MSILLKNATFIDWKTLAFSNVNILTEPGNGTLQFVEKNETLSGKKGVEVIDCTNKLVTKSFAVGHHHAYSALSLGMGAPPKVPGNFYEILQFIWWTLDKCLDPEMIEYSALVTAIASAKAGSTFIIDHHSSPSSVKNSLKIIAKAFDRVGVSHLLCYEISDRDGFKVANEGLEETESYLAKHQGLVGLHASFTVSNETLKEASDLMTRSGSGIHVHVAEDLYDQDLTLRKYGKRVVERLNDYGVLSSSKSILAHCLHLDENEKQIIQSSLCWIVQNAESNMNNNVGHFNSEHLGSNIMLGTDGMHSDMLRSAQAAFLSGQGFDPISPPAAYLRLRNVNRYVQSNEFKGDEDNNLIVLDYDSPTKINSENFYSHFVYGLKSNHIRDVIANGKLIVRNRKMQTVDEDEIYEESRKCANRLWKKMKIM